jgi:hypothetical protein
MVEKKKGSEFSEIEAIPNIDLLVQQASALRHNVRGGKIPIKELLSEGNATSKVPDHVLCVICRELVDTPVKCDGC